MRVILVDNARLMLVTLGYNHRKYVGRTCLDSHTLFKKKFVEHYEASFLISIIITLVNNRSNPFLSL